MNVTITSHPALEANGGYCSGNRATDVSLSQQLCHRAQTLNMLANLPRTAHLTTQEAAAHLGTTPAVLRVWRSQGKGPRFKGRGHFVRYVKDDLNEFMSGFDHRFDAPAA
jgi:hypothetical protein